MEKGRFSASVERTSLCLLLSNLKIVSLFLSACSFTFPCETQNGTHAVQICVAELEKSR